MGRWGHRLFEGDQDLDIAIELGDTLEKPLNLSHMIHQTDMIASQECQQFYETEEYKAQLCRTVAELRTQLDTGLGDNFFKKLCEKEDTRDGKYRVILGGALMMRAGAKMKPEHIQHLRDLVPQINCNFVYTPPIMDAGFREPGRVQFLAALDNYSDGTPRNFQEPSCFTCGKITADLGFAPKKCARCKKAWYCSEDCQQAHWPYHKLRCVPPKQLFWLNV